MPYTDYITKVLGLEDAIILKVEENEKQHDIYLMMQRRAHVCPVCGLETIRVHDYRWQKVKDLAAFGKAQFFTSVKDAMFVGIVIRGFLKRSHSCPNIIESRPA